MRAVTPNWPTPGAEKTDQEQVMDEITPTMHPVPADSFEALAKSNAELAAGSTEPAEVVDRRTRDCVARIEEQRAGRGKHGVIPTVD
jgi:hypothetical protein